MASSTSYHTHCNNPPPIVLAVAARRLERTEKDKAPSSIHRERMQTLWPVEMTTLQRCVLLDLCVRLLLFEKMLEEFSVPRCSSEAR